MKEECNYERERKSLSRRSDGKWEKKIFTEEWTKGRTDKERDTCLVS
jgi:hypothetical protein